MHCFVSMYLSGRKSLSMFCLSSKHGVPSVPCIVWSTVSMSFYCRNAYFVLGVPNSSYYSDPASRSVPRLRINANPHQAVALRLRNHTQKTIEEQKRRGKRGEKVSFPGHLGSIEHNQLALHFLMKAAASTGGRKQDHCSPGEILVGMDSICGISLHGGWRFPIPL